MAQGGEGQTGMGGGESAAGFVQALSRAERLISQQLARITAEHGLVLEQWRVLDLLTDGSGRSMGEIADDVLVPPPTLTRLTDRMVTDNLVHRRIDPADRRRVLLFASPRGKKLHAQVQQDITRFEYELDDEADLVDVPRLTDMLTRLIRHATRYGCGDFEPSR